MRLALVRLSTVLIVGSALSCADASTGLGTNATVRFVDIEGGCWQLVTPHGHYEPINLPAEFAVDGLAVRVSLRAAPDRVSICMMGQLVRIDHISAR